MFQLFKSARSLTLATLVLAGAGGLVPSVALSQEAQLSAEAVPIEAAKTIECDVTKTTAHEMVGQVSDEVMQIIRETEAGDITVDEAYEMLDKLMSQVVDFRYIVLNVMGRKAASEASREQLQAFAKEFKQGLINTYSKGMTSFADNTVNVLPPEDDAPAGKNVTVYQEIVSESGKVVVSYSIAANKEQKWVLRNVVLSGINLGKQFRSQFRSAMKQNNNDLDAVIAGWNS